MFTRCLLSRQASLLLNSEVPRFMYAINNAKSYKSKVSELVQDVNDDLDSYEMQFEVLNKAFPEHIRENYNAKERQINNIVKQKYFKTNQLNFLTWQDKQQIRFLHQNDPELWNVNKLSDSFPALPDVITKIIKSHWGQPKSIEKHDMKVKENWKLFKKGKLNISYDLANHLKQFTERTAAISDNKIMENNVKTPLIDPLIKSEFSAIIDSYRKEKPTNTNNYNKMVKRFIAPTKKLIN